MAPGEGSRRTLAATAHDGGAATAVPDIVVVGAASRDLYPSDPRGWRLGGGVTYSARLLGQLGLSVGALIGLDAVAAEAHELHDLRALGVVIEVVALDRGPVFDNRQTSQGRVQTAHSVSDSLAPHSLPARWRGSRAFLLNPVAGEIDDAWADVIPEDALLGLGYQGLLRILRLGEVVGSRPLVPGRLSWRADLAALSHEDVRAGAAHLRRLLGRDGQRLVVTEGERGALQVERSAGRFRMRYVPAVPARSGADATGAGDTFLAAWLAATLTLGRGDANDARSLTWAALCASLLVEGDGITRQRVRDRVAVLRRPDAAGS